MPHTMSRMGDVLAGFHATWEFAEDSVLIRYERGIRTPKLLQALGERRVPLAAIDTVTLAPGRRGTVVLRAVPRAGADPLMEAAAGQLKENCDPYRLVLPAEREELAEFHAAQIRDRLGPGVAEPAESFLVAAPEGPQQFKAYDGKASFNGSVVSFRWSRTGATSAKWKAGDQSFPVAALSGVEWRSPEILDGYLRLLPRHPAPGTGTGPAADHDPAAVVFGLGYGPVHESLPFAAAVLAATRSSAARSGTGEAASAVAALRSDPADIAERIRHLGELHLAGLLTDEEFTTKKKELLAQL
ncbi:Short C-terminal domain-containing protein [Streptomyces sp. LcepLS]|nr:Short C-terminal domain-containing protein [Streptomyces sp. TverLS-915]SCE71807.1 Short C-terminal domain-containing protein [Streptomyces sp. LcepLS]